MYADQVKVGPVSATRQAVEVATAMADNFAHQHNDGLMGLGFGNANTVPPQQQRTFVENVRDQLRLSLFAVTLRSVVLYIYSSLLLHE